jgi:hypothetical protein
MSETEELKDNIIYKLIVLDVLKEKYNWNEL